MLLGHDPEKLQEITFRYGRKEAVFIGAVVTAFNVELHKTGEFNNRTGCSEDISFRLSIALHLWLSSYVYGSLLQKGRMHLACNETIPDKLIKIMLITRKVIFNTLRSPYDRGWPDGFMCLLCRLLAFVNRGFWGHILLAELSPD